MELDILIEEPRWDAAELGPLARSACGAVVAHLRLGNTEISLLGCDDARIAVLNADFRDKPTPTNVLSWPAQDLAAEADGGQPAQPEPDFPDMPLELGDIAIAFETCTREAQEQDKPFADHVTHLLVHGTLHLLGFDHIRPKDAQLMERLEVEILAKMGISDPYE